MNSNEPQYSRFPQHPEDNTFSQNSKPPQHSVTHVEEDWADQAQSPSIPRSRSLLTLLREWKWEFATWLLGSCALGTIVALLIIYRDHPLRDWTSEIRPAPVVAALSQIAQSALLFSVSSCIGQLKWDWLRTTRSSSDLGKFEEASRGPKGSLMLLPKTRLHLVSVGALATVLLLVFSPSTQLTNTIRVRNVDITSSVSHATIGRSVQYMNPAWNTSLVDFDRHKLFNNSRVGDTNFHPHMFRAVLSGVLDDKKTLSDVVGNCSAEACQWNEYTTLAVCASVEDVSSQGQVRNERFSISGTSWVPPSQGLSGQPDTFWMAAPFQDVTKLTNGKMLPISDIFMAYYPQCNDQNQTRGDLKPWRSQLSEASNWKAFKGTLNLCLQTLSSSYNNTMNTTITETHKGLTWKLTDPKNTVSQIGAVCLSEPFQNRDYCVGERDLMQWASSIQRTWEGAAAMQEDWDNYYTGQFVPNIVADVIGPNPVMCDPNLGPGYGLEGFTRRINNIAVAMTNALRTGNTTSQDSFFPGSEWTSEQYIAVDFRWLTPPGAIYLGITLFLFATIFKSRKDDVPLWKSSPLVLLQAVERNNGMQTLKQVENNAELTQIRLKYTGEDWYVQDVSGRPPRIEQ